MPYDNGGICVMLYPGLPTPLASIVGFNKVYYVKTKTYGNK